MCFQPFIRISIYLLSEIAVDRVLEDFVCVFQFLSLTCELVRLGHPLLL